MLHINTDLLCGCSQMPLVIVSLIVDKLCRKDKADFTGLQVLV